MGLLGWVAQDIDEEEEAGVSKKARVDLNNLMAGATKLTKDQQIRLAALRVAAWGIRATHEVVAEATAFEKFIRGESQ